MKKAVLFLLILLAAIAFSPAAKKSEIVIASLDDAKNARIGVMPGSTGEAITIARFPQAQIKSFDDIMDAVCRDEIRTTGCDRDRIPLGASGLERRIRKWGCCPKPLDY